MLELQSQTPFSNLRTLGSGGGVTASERTELRIATVMVRKSMAADLAGRMKRDFGAVLPDGPRLVRAGALTMLGTGPGRWIALREGDAGFVPGLVKSLDGVASVANQSSALGVVKLSGPGVRAIMEKGLQVDFCARAFPAGSVAVTAIAHVGVTLWKLDETPTVEVAVARSLADSFLHWLEASAAVHGLQVVVPPAGRPAS